MRRYVTAWSALASLTWSRVPGRAVVALQHPTLACFFVEAFPEVGTRQGVPEEARLDVQGLQSSAYPRPSRDQRRLVVRIVIWLLSR